MWAVGKTEYKGPMKVGIGTQAQEAALKKFGCEKVFFPHELRQVLDNRDIPAYMFLRPEDTIVMLQPNVLKLDWFRKIIAAGVSWQVPGHDPVKFENEEERKAWRKLKPTGVSARLIKDNRGRKPTKWPTPTPKQVAVIVALWHSGKKRSEVVKQVQDLVGKDVPDWWVRDIVIAETGSAKRTPK